MQTAQLLEELAGEIRRCPLCRLSETRTHAVPGEGDVRARIMFVGEGPGEREDKTGRPFIGPAGNFLNSLLDKAGIERSDVFITNIVKCRPPNNRVPLVDEVLACRDYLDAQIAIIGPKIICPLGGPSLSRLLGPQFKISKVRAQVFRKSGILYIPLFHPAAALHRAELQPQLEADILKLKELINREIDESEITDLASEIACDDKTGKPSDEPQTLSLF